MKKISFLLAGLCIVAITSQKAQAQQANSTATAQTTATIITPIQITRTADLNFGNIIAGTNAGSVTVSTNNTRTAGGGALLYTAVPGTVTSAEFKVTGYPNAAFSIAAPQSFNVTREGGSEVMQVTNFVTTPSGNSTLGGDGTQIIKLGATLNVQANQQAGVYKNTTDLTVTVAYN